MKLKDLQEYAHCLSTQQGWGKETIQTRLHYLKSEILEATEEISSIESAKTKEEQSIHTENLGLELFDILWNVSEIANRYGIDLTVSAEKKMQINSQRSFSKKPTEVHMIPHEEVKPYEETHV